DLVAQVRWLREERWLDVPAVAWRDDDLTRQARRQVDDLVHRPAILALDDRRSVEDGRRGGLVELDGDLRGEPLRRIGGAILRGERRDRGTQRADERGVAAGIRVRGDVAEVVAAGRERRRWAVEGAQEERIDAEEVAGAVLVVAAGPCDDVVGQPIVRAELVVERVVLHLRAPGAIDGHTGIRDVP